MDKYEELLMQY